MFSNLLKSTLSAQKVRESFAAKSQRNKYKRNQAVIYLYGLATEIRSCDFAVLAYPILHTRTTATHGRVSCNKFGATAFFAAFAEHTDLHSGRGLFVGLVMRNPSCVF